MFVRVLKYTFEIRRSKVKFKVNCLNVPNQNSYEKNVPWQGLSHYILSFSKTIIIKTQKNIRNIFYSFSTISNYWKLKSNF